MDKLSYALGMSIAHNMLSSGVKKLTFDDFCAGVKATFNGENPALEYEEAGAILNDFFAKLEAEQKASQAAEAEKFIKEGEEFLAKNKQEEGVVELPSGLQYKVLKSGNGKKPSATSKVKCHYEGKFLNGNIFDSSYARNEPAVFGLNQVISGWTEGLQLMSEGDEWMLYLPYQLAYGEHGAPGAIPPYSTLVFKVELIEVL